MENACHSIRDEKIPILHYFIDSHSNTEKKREFFYCSCKHERKKLIWFITILELCLFVTSLWWYILRNISNMVIEKFITWARSFWNSSDYETHKIHLNISLHFSICVADHFNGLFWSASEADGWITTPVNFLSDTLLQ